MLKNYRGRFPFKLATTSYIYPDEIVPNVAKLGPFFDEIELVLFESEKRDSIPDSGVIDHLVELSKLYRLGFNIHLPLDVSLGDERDDVRTHGTSVMKTVMERTLPLNPSVYTLHLDFINPPLSPLPKRLCHNEQEAVVPATQDRRPSQPSIKNTTQSLTGGGEESVQERDIEAWQRRVSQSIKEILDSGIEGKRISIETLAYPFEWVEDKVREFGLSVCLDIGHILTHGYDLRHYLETYLPGTSIIHLHGFRNGSDHLGIDTLPEPDLNLIVSALHHYHGIVSIEVFSMNELRSSLSILEEKWIHH